MVLGEDPLWELGSLDPLLRPTLGKEDPGVIVRHLIVAVHRVLVFLVRDVSDQLGCICLGPD